ncbi:MAG: NYN domain-containing protein [Rhizobiaceae bacterium]
MSFSSGNPVAVLIDAESVEAGDAKNAVAALSARFSPLILHAFGDFRDSALQEWSNILEEFEGQALQVTPTAGHENSVHICLTMNAMELLHADSASAVCIFCGNGDFSQLAVRVRRAGLPVLGFGTGRSGETMAAWFDSWQVIGIDDEGDFEQPSDLWTEDDAPEEVAFVAEQLEQGDGHYLTEPQAPAELAHAGEVAAPEKYAASKPVTTKVTDTDIVAFAQAQRLRGSDDETGPADHEVDAGLFDADAMAAIEGKSPAQQRITTEPPPLADMTPGMEDDPDVGELLTK